jgi:aminomethyltransferase
MNAALKRTPIYSAHLASKAKMMAFAGYDMPVRYGSVVDEHLAVRNAVGLFDVSHMGEVEFKGPGAESALNNLLTNDVAKLPPGKALYSLMCREDGGIIDDVIVYRLAPTHFLVCVNASRRSIDVAWMLASASTTCDVQDTSDGFSQIALQGPRAKEVIDQVMDGQPSGLARFGVQASAWSGAKCWVARTGYTGEDGFEIYAPSEQGLALWKACLAKAEPLGGMPIGLAARDTLRLEMRYPLYGNDIDETTNPFEAGLGWAVKLQKTAFIGREALVKAKENLKRQLVGFVLQDRGVIRAGYPVLHQGTEVGTVTSGGFSPSLEESIGLAYVPTEAASLGTALEINVRGRRLAATVVKTPFYSP